MIPIKKDRYLLLRLMNKLAMKVALFLIVLFVLTRIAIVWYFGEVELYSSMEILETFRMGFRFDIKFIATILLLFIYIPALLFIYLGKNIFLNIIKKIIFIVLFIIITFSFIDFGYYLFFGNEIDLLFFGIIDDGTSAVIQSLLGDSRLVIILIVATVFLLGYVKYYSTYFSIQVKEKKDFSYIKVYILLFMIIVFMGILARGSFDTFPLRKKTINTIENSFLSNAVLNPMWHMYYAYRDLKRDNFSMSSKKILKKAKVNSIAELLEKSGYSDKNPLKILSQKNKMLEEKPPHIIFVLKEGWSTQIALDQSKENDVFGEFAKHANEDYLFKSFFSNAYGTNNTIEELLLNSPIKGVSQSSAKETAFSFSSILPFKKHGYRTLFLSGGTSTWRNHNRFWIKQGFDKYLGRATIEKYFHTTCDNTWGAYDQLLFKYLQKTLAEGDKSGKPSFTFVLTTNNHPPVDLPEAYKSPKFNLEKIGLDPDDTVRYNMLRGYNYQTNALGEFLTWLKASKLKDKVIVVATGDHVLKGFANYNSSKMQYLKYAVPTYFYVPKQYDTLSKVSKDIVGSHNDIFPTLYELSLSSTEYYNFGTPLMFKDEKNAFGWNEQNCFIFQDGVVDNKMKFFPWKENTTPRKYLQKEASLLKKNKEDRISIKHSQIWLQKYFLTKEYENKNITSAY